jgi:nitroreductase
MDIYEAIRARRSIRSYKTDAIPEDKLNRVLEAARLAPSARNRQEWKFVVVRDAGARQELVDACNGQAFVAQAPVVLVMCSTENKDVMRCGQKTGTVDLSIALSYATLAATAEGLGTCWLGSYLEDKVKSVLGIPAEAMVVAVSPLGIPAESPAARSRKPASEVVSHDRW